MHQASQLYIELVGELQRNELLDMSSELSNTASDAIGCSVGVVMVMYGYSNPARRCCRG